MGLQLIGPTCDRFVYFDVNVIINGSFSWPTCMVVLGLLVYLISAISTCDCPSLICRRWTGKYWVLF